MFQIWYFLSYSFNQAQNNPISIAESYLEKKLGNKCEGQNKPERVEEILMVLKAVGNARRPSRFRGMFLRTVVNFFKHSELVIVKKCIFSKIV